MKRAGEKKGKRARKTPRPKKGQAVPKAATPVLMFFDLDVTADDLVAAVRRAAGLDTGKGDESVAKPGKADPS